MRSGWWCGQRGTSATAQGTMEPDQWAVGHGESFRPMLLSTSRNGPIGKVGELLTLVTLFLMSCSVTAAALGTGSADEVRNRGFNSPQTTPSSSSGTSTATAAHTPYRFGGLYTGPYFDPGNPTHVNVQQGHTASLPCRVRQTGNKAVSWVRKTDGALLSVDADAFIGDGRFGATYAAAIETWTLQIRSVQAQDAGPYECQVSSEPKTSLLMNLHVVVPKVQIRGPPDIYVKSGSSVIVQCVISDFLEAPPTLSWALNDSLLVEKKTTWLLGAKETKVAPALFSSQTTNNLEERASFLLQKTDLQQSLVWSLKLESVTSEDTGNYTCSPTHLLPTSATLHVLNGEHPAAMQHGENNSPHSQAYTRLLTLTLALLMLWHYGWHTGHERFDPRPLSKTS